MRNLALTTLFALTCAPLLATGMPPGNYRQTCKDVFLAGSTLVGDCKKPQIFPWERSHKNSALRDATSCGYVENIDGQLTCTMPKGSNSAERYADCMRDGLGKGRSHESPDDFCRNWAR